MTEPLGHDALDPSPRVFLQPGHGSGQETLDHQPQRFGGVDPAALQIKDLFGIHRRDSGAMAAADVVGENLQLGYGIGASALREQEIAVLLKGLAARRSRLDPDQTGI